MLSERKLSPENVFSSFRKFIFPVRNIEHFSGGGDGVGVNCLKQQRSTLLLYSIVGGWNKQWRNHNKMTFWEFCKYTAKWGGGGGQGFLINVG